MNKKKKIDTHNKFFNWIETLKPTWYTSVPTLHQAILAKAKESSDILTGSHLRLRVREEITLQS